jgi:hypothetical protein
MHAPPVAAITPGTLELGTPALDPDAWESDAIRSATSLTAIIALRPVSGSSIGITVE